MATIEICFLIIVASFVVAQLIQAVTSIKTSMLLKKFAQSSELQKKAEAERIEEMFRKIVLDLELLSQEVDAIQIDAFQSKYLRSDNERVKRAYKKRKVKAIEHKEKNPA